MILRAENPGRDPGRDLKKTSFEEKQGKPSKLGTGGLNSIATVAGN